MTNRGATQEVTQQILLEHFLWPTHVYCPATMYRVQLLQQNEGIIYSPKMLFEIRLLIDCKIKEFCGAKLLVHNYTTDSQLSKYVCMYICMVIRRNFFNSIDFQHINELSWINKWQNIWNCSLNEWWYEFHDYEISITLNPHPWDAW